MREIEFRAKGLYKDTWYYGNFVEYKRNLTYEIVDLDEDVMNISHYVRKETLCQYTGLKDKNGKKIFERDIVKDVLGQIGQIVYKEKYSAFVVDKWECGYALWFDKGIEVIGNIYDNPELLGEEV